MIDTKDPRVFIKDAPVDTSILSGNEKGTFIIMTTKKHLFLLLAAAVILALFSVPGYCIPGKKNIKKTVNNTRLLVLAPDKNKHILGTYVEVLEDKESTLTINDVLRPDISKKFIPGNKEIPQYGFSNSSYWLRFRLKNELHHDATWFLELAYPHMNNFELYTPDDSGAYTMRKTGDEEIFNNREVDYKNFIFKISVETNAEQMIYMRFSGECSKEFPLTLWDPVVFAQQAIKETLGFGIYYGIILVMMIYNLILFFSIRDRSYLFYVLYIMAYGLVQMAYNGMAFQYLWPAFPAWHNISMPFLIGLAIICMALFSKSFLHVREFAVKLRIIFPIIMGLGFFLMLLSVFGSYLLAIRLAMLLMVISSITILIAGIICIKNNYRPARFFLISWIAFLGGMVLIALNKLNILPTNFITEYAIQIGSAMEVTLLSIALADRINIINQEKKLAQAMAMDALQEKDKQKDVFLFEITEKNQSIEGLNVELQKKLDDLDEANKKIILSEEKYRFLIEGSNEIIFSLDENFNFVTVNNAVRDHLNVQPESILSKNFLDLIHENIAEDAVSKKLVREKLDVFSKNKKPIVFRADFTSFIKSEPKEMQVTLEYINIEGKNEILGKATNTHEDVLIKYFECEKQRFNIENYLMTADEVTHRITRNLVKFLESKEITLLRIALREIIINAIEHGNLNITFDEKTRALMNDEYFEFIATRQQDPRFRDRKVEIVYSIDKEKIVYKVTDEGDGFDYRVFLKSGSDSANEKMLSHGRGISLVMHIFDDIQFNKKGNQVLLVKHLCRSVENLSAD